MKKIIVFVFLAFLIFIFCKEKSVTQPVAENQTPIIVNISAVPSTLEIDFAGLVNSATITVEVVDEDDNDLTYAFYTTEGTLSSQSNNTISYKPPLNPGDYCVKCSVSDGKATVVDSVSVNIYQGIGQGWIPFDQSIYPQEPSVTVIKSDDLETIVEFSIPGIEVENIIEGDETFKSLRFPDYYTTLDIGKPQLPAISVLVGIPPTSKVKVSAIDSTITINLENCKVYPFQEPCLEGEQKEFYIDSDFYKMDVLYPEVTSQVGKPAIMRDVRNVILRVYPIRYNPAKKELYVCINLKVKLEYYGTDTYNVLTRIGEPIPPAWDAMYRNLFINYDYLSYINRGN